MANAVVETVEDRAVVEIGYGNVMAGGAQLLGELANALGEALAVGEQDDVGHGVALVHGLGRSPPPWWRDMPRAGTVPVRGQPGNLAT